MPIQAGSRAMRFTLKQIEYFVAAGDSGSITLASERVHISQPSISAAISQLEQEFGFQLFIRHHAQGLSLTPQGAHFLREAKTLLLQAEELNAIASELSSKVTGPLEIGCLVTLYPLLVPELVHSFRDKHKAARVHAVASDQSGIFHKLRRGEISLALSYDMNIPPDVRFEPLADLPPFLFVAANHRFAKRKTVPLTAIAEEPFLLLDLPFSRDYFLSLFHQQGLVPNLAGEFEHMDVIRSLVARGDGYSIGNIRPRNKASLDGRALAYLMIEGPARPLTLGVVSLKDVRRTRTAEAFVELCRELVHNAHIPGMA
jgi:DNA-binding transcriptional LysR family regulator